MAPRALMGRAKRNALRNPIDSQSTCVRRAESGPSDRVRTVLTLPVIGFLTSLGRNDRTDLAEACNYPSSRPISEVLHSPEGRLVDLRLSATRIKSPPPIVPFVGS